MDPRKALADDLMQLLQRTISAQTQLEQTDTPIPGFLFDQIVALIKLLLEWLGIVKTMSQDEYNAIVKQAQQRKSDPNH